MVRTEVIRQANYISKMIVQLQMILNNMQANNIEPDLVVEESFNNLVYVLRKQAERYDYTAQCMTDGVNA